MAEREFRLAEEQDRYEAANLFIKALAAKPELVPSRASGTEAGVVIRDGAKVLLDFIKTGS